MLDKLAEELKEARKKTGLSLLQISAKSKIDLKFLESMEKGNFSFLPEIYVKAFIKDFANIINLDPVLMLKKYDAFKMGRNYEEIKPPEPMQPPLTANKSEPPVPPKAEETLATQAHEMPAEKKSNGNAVKKKSFKSRKKEKAAAPSQYSPGPTFDAVAKKTAPSDMEDEKRKRNLVISLIAVCGVILLLLIYFLFFTRPTEIVVTERPIEEVIKEKKERFSDPNITKTEQPALIPAADSLSLLIKANDTSWVKIILDDFDEEEFILFPQSQKIIKTKHNYKITFGNYTRIELFLNNKPLDPGNNKKSVVHVLIDSTGLKYLSTPPVI